MEQDLHQYRAVVVRDSSRHLPLLTRRVSERQAILRVATIQQKIDAQVFGLGVGYLPRHCIVSQLESGDLVTPPMATEITSVPLYLVWKSNNKGRALRWFIERLRVLTIEPRK